MLKPSPQPTLLVFTLGAAAEQRRRRLLPAVLGHQERAMHQRLLDSVLAAGRACGCRLLVSCPRALDLPTDASLVPQQGKTFGERLSRAFEAASEESHGPVILVGSDVPGLEAEHLRQALAALERDPLSTVVGPSPDGGLYLLASQENPDDLLRRISWCRKETRASLLAELRRSGGKAFLLEPLVDLDRRHDLERWLSRLAPRSIRWRSLAAELTALLARLVKPLRSLPIRPTPRRALPVTAGRAPPYLSLITLRIP